MKKNNPEMIAEILDQIVFGKSLVSILKSKPEYPRYSTFMEWLNEDKSLADKYTRAKEEQADFLAEELLEIADETSHDTIINENGREVPNSEWINRSRLRVDTRKWIASKLKPKKYGDRIQHAGDPSAPVVITTITETKFRDDE
ncbi:MAG: terminase small subunit protein [Gammaproteobacteria bacterium]|nr:terminase small subunit protein [Gammaproteobacteria bacterium]